MGAGAVMAHTRLSHLALEAGAGGDASIVVGLHRDNSSNTVQRPTSALVTP